MKKIPGFLAALVLMSTLAFGQDEDAIQPPTFAVHFFFNDFKSAAAVRANSLGTVFKNQQFSKMKDMDPGIALNFIKGVNKRFDLTTTLAGSFLDYPIPDKAEFGSDYFLLEGDASVRAKMFSSNALLNPYLQLGMGASFYKSYLGAYVPVGAGMQVNLMNQVYVLVNAQYRIPISEVSAYHFWFGLGIGANIGKKKAND